MKLEELHSPSASTCVVVTTYSRDNIYNNTSIEYFLQLVVCSEDYRDELSEDFLLTSDWDVLNGWHRLSVILGNDATSTRQGLIGGAERYSCHRTNNRRVKADLIFEWRKEQLYAREKQGFLQIARRGGPFILNIDAGLVASILFHFGGKPTMDCSILVLHILLQRCEGSCL